MDLQLEKPERIHYTIPYDSITSLLLRENFTVHCIAMLPASSPAVVKFTSSWKQKIASVNITFIYRHVLGYSISISFFVPAPTKSRHPRPILAEFAYYATSSHTICSIFCVFSTSV
jgi:hypothetical protein